MLLTGTLDKCLPLTSNKNMRRTSVFCLAFVIAEMFGPFINASDGDTSPKPVPRSADPHFRLLLENNHVRVWTLELRPNEKTKLVSS